MPTPALQTERRAEDRPAPLSVARPVEVPCGPDPRRADLSADALRTVRMMHLLERIAKAFNEAGVPLMALKGAALNLTLYRHPQDRPMVDLDLLVKPADSDRARAILEDVGCLRSDIVFREDFFPRYYYEIEYTAGSVDPVLIDLHVRPFRLLRYARLLPDEAIWERAVPVRMGSATVYVPSAENMLLHLAVHSAIHGNGRGLWLHDIKRWAEARGDALDWDRLVDAAGRWRLARAVLSGFRATGAAPGPVCSPSVCDRLARMPANWRDRLALWHAPLDGGNLVVSFLVSVLTTPDWRFVLGYVRDVLVPDRAYMDEWCTRHDCGNRRWAHVRRCLAPIMRRLPRFKSLTKKIEVRQSTVHGLGVFARREFKRGEVIGRYRGRPIDRDGTYVAYHTDGCDTQARHEITGPLRFLNHSCHPKAALVNFRLVALQRIAAGGEITVDYGEGTCECCGEKERDER
ncbi:MAG: nucleotidyltransferase family protein [Planctomycetota bacterium]